MSQHDQNLANASGAAFRADLNLALAAIFSNSSGATEPAVTVAGMLWYDTSTSKLKFRNAANSAWITLFDVSAASARLLLHAGALSTPSLAADGDVNTGLYFPAADTLGLVAGGVELLRITSSLLSFLGTGAVQLTSGTTAERPGSPVAGMLRYNSTTGSIEGYFGGQWTALGGTPSPSVAVKTAGYTATTAEDLIIVNSASETAHVLYAANATGRKSLEYRNINSGIPVIAAAGSDKIVDGDGNEHTSINLAPGSGVKLIPDGSSKWYVM